MSPTATLPSRTHAVLLALITGTLTVALVSIRTSNREMITLAFTALPVALLTIHRLWTNPSRVREPQLRHRLSTRLRHALHAATLSVNGLFWIYMITPAVAPDSPANTGPVATPALLVLPGLVLFVASGLWIELRRSTPNALPDGHTAYETVDAARSHREHRTSPDPGGNPTAPAWSAQAWPVDS